MTRFVSQLSSVRTSTQQPIVMRDGVCLALLVIAGAGLYAFESASLIYALLAIAGLCGLVSPAAAIAAILVATPLVQRPIRIGDSSWQVLEMSILLALSALSIRLLLDAVRAPSFRPFLRLLEPFRFTALALALVVIGAFTIFTVADERFRPDSIRELRWVIVEPVAGLFLFRWAARNSYRKLIVGAFVVTGIAVAGYGLVQLALGRGVVIADGVERATGLYRHPNNLALYLDRVAIFCLALAIAVRSRHRLVVRLVGPPVLKVVGAADHLEHHRRRCLDVDLALDRSELHDHPPATSGCTTR